MKPSLAIANREGKIVPSSDFQLSFLSKIQRIFNEGEFAATYKFALILGIADLCIDKTADCNESVFISFQELGGKFIAYYWQQSQPFARTGGEEQVLLQNHGRQAAIVSSIRAFREKYPRETINTAQHNRAFSGLLASVIRTIKEQPVKFIQNLAGGRDPFIFEEHKDGLLLRDGVAFCLRRFHPLVTQMARAQWVNHIRGIALNTRILGPSDDLESFLFSASRQALGLLREGLMDLRSKCFYCDGSLVRGGDIDHFIPFYLYPRDMVPNFVLAHASCNRSKSNKLASGEHLERWLDFSEQHRVDLAQISQIAGIRFEERGSLSVALWAYQNASSAGDVAWQEKQNFVQVLERDINLIQGRISSLSKASYP